MDTIQKLTAFRTQDEELALALITAGCRFATQEEGGPAQNHYTPQKCRNLGLLPSGGVLPQEFERAVMTAHERKRKGIVTWIIAKDATFETAMKAWDVMVNAAAEADREKLPFIVPPEVALLSEETVMRMFYVKRRNSAEMQKFIWVNSPSLSIGNASVKPRKLEGVPDHIAAKVAYDVSGEGKLWSLDLPDEKRERLGIPLKPKS